MSRLNWNIWIVLVFIAFWVSFLTVFADDSQDEILAFYTDRAAQTYKSRNPIEAGVSFSMTAKTYFKFYDDDMVAQITDSSLATYYYSFGELDSMLHVVKSIKKQDSVNFSYLNIFEGDYRYNFYPNDTGGNELSIGFDSKDFNPEIPVGLAVIDRERYFLIWLHTYYLSHRRDHRKSKSFRFIEHEGYIFPDSVWEVKARRGILSEEFYRIETALSDFKIFR